MGSRPIPLRGVIGIVAVGTAELDQAVEADLGCVEVRADLLLDNGLSLEEVLALVRAARRQRIGCLFTLRHPDHGGHFEGTEAERVAIIAQAGKAGADMVDVEWGSEAAQAVLAGDTPVVLSHHDFDRMPSERELALQTERMAREQPAAIKIVPTADTLADAVRMLQWVQERERGPARIGFAMGAVGRCSRILTIAYGAPITYASFGDSVAPGQVPLSALHDVYRAHERGPGTRVYAVLGDSEHERLLVSDCNWQLTQSERDLVCVPFEGVTLDDMLVHLDALRIDGVAISAEQGELVMALADVRDERAEEEGVADWLQIERGEDTRVTTAWRCGHDAIVKRFCAGEG